MSKKKLKKSWWKLQVEEQKAEKEYYRISRRITETFKGQLCPAREDVIEKLKREQEWIKKNLRRA